MISQEQYAKFAPSDGFSDAYRRDVTVFPGPAVNPANPTFAEDVRVCVEAVRRETIAVEDLKVAYNRLQRIPSLSYRDEVHKRAFHLVIERNFCEGPSSNEDGVPATAPTPRTIPASLSDADCGVLWLCTPATMPGTNITTIEKLRYSANASAVLLRITPNNHKARTEWVKAEYQDKWTVVDYDLPNKE